MVDDGEDDEFEKFRLNFSRCRNRDTKPVAFLVVFKSFSFVFKVFNI